MERQGSGCVLCPSPQTLGVSLSEELHPHGCLGDPSEVHRRLWPWGEAPVGPPAICPSVASSREEQLFSSVVSQATPSCLPSSLPRPGSTHIFSVTQRWLMAGARTRLSLPSCRREQIRQRPSEVGRGPGKVAPSSRLPSAYLILRTVPSQ